MKQSSHCPILVPVSAGCTGEYPTTSGSGKFSAVLTTFTAHTCTYTAVRYCSITESAPLLDEDVTGQLSQIRGAVQTATF